MASFMTTDRLSSLNVLLKATSKQHVEKCLSLVFASRIESSIECINAIRSILSLDLIEEAEALYSALLECIQVSLLSGTVESLAELFGEKGTEVDPKLRSLVGKIIESRLTSWKEASSMNRVSTAKLLDHDWALHIQRSSSQVTAMSIPSVIVQLKVQDQPWMIGKVAMVNNVDFELSEESLNTMLDGLGKIKEQLSLLGK